MADLINREDLLAEYDRVHIGPPGGARKLIADAKAVDAVPVVRCKDCKHHKVLKDYRGSTLPVCGWHNLNVEMHEDDFCSYGERRTDNG